MAESTATPPRTPEKEESDVSPNFASEEEKEEESNEPPTMAPMLVFFFSASTIASKDMTGSRSGPYFEWKQGRESAWSEEGGRKQGGSEKTHVGDGEGEIRGSSGGEGGIVTGVDEFSR